MADPGSAIGAVSLALQVVQGLATYYTRFKSYGDDVKITLSRIKRIESILSTLKRTVSRLNPDDSSVSEVVCDCIEECLQAVQKLDVYRQKCFHAENMPDTPRKKAQKGRKKATYPFRKSTLEGIQVETDRLLENLQIVVQTLQL